MSHIKQSQVRMGLVGLLVLLVAFLFYWAKPWCPESMEEETSLFVNAGSTEPAYDFNCNGFVDSADLFTALDARAACELPKRECQGN